METQDLNSDSILPPGPRWSPDHLRLHRHLRHHPELLPAGAPLLLAISGGQDSMALLALLRDLQRLHQLQRQLLFRHLHQSLLLHQLRHQLLRQHRHPPLHLVQLQLLAIANK